MKKFIAYLFIISLSGSGLYAQSEDFRTEAGLGLKVGINSANIFDTEGDDFEHDSRLGLAAGIFISLPLGKFLGVQPEIMYSQKGYSTNGSVLGISYDYTRKTDYIDIPLQLQIKPAPVLTLLVGPQYSFLISKGVNFDSDILDEETQNNIEDIDIRKNTLGLVTGLDLNFNRFVISARAAWDMQNNNGDGTSDSPRFRNVVVQATVGVFF